MPQTRDISRILMIQLRQIGDVLLATPSIRLLRDRFPGAEIYFLTEKKCAPMLYNNPELAKIWELDKKALRNPLDQVRFYRRVASPGYDLVVDFQQLPRAKWAVLFSRARLRVSFEPPWYNRPLYTHWTRPENGYAAMSKASALAPLGARWSGQKPELFLTGEERSWALRYSRDLGVDAWHALVTVDASHRRATRRWPARHYGRVLGLAAREVSEARFLLPYGPGERDEAEYIRGVAADMGAGDNVIVPDKVLTLREMAACIERSALHFGNCSAPRHVAVAVNTPSLVIRGATSEAWTFPSQEHKTIAKNPPCQPCNKNACSDIRCLEELAPEEVLPELVARLRPEARMA